MKILLITPSIPWPLNSGGNQRTNHLFKALSELGTVDMLLVRRHALATEDILSILKQDYNLLDTFVAVNSYDRFPWKIFKPLSIRFSARLAHAFQGWSIDYATDKHLSSRICELQSYKHYDVIVGRYLWPLAQADPFGLAPIYVDVDDFDSDVAEAKIDFHLISKWWTKRRITQFRKSESKILSKCSHVWVSKSSDLSRIGNATASVLPNIPLFPNYRINDFPASETSSQTILIVGALTHTPNVEAVDQFLKWCWPLIKSKHPNAIFRIVGSGMTFFMKSRWEKHRGVVPVGFSDKLDLEYQKSAFVVVPLWKGGGTKIKVLEAAMYERACIVSDYSLRGYEHILHHEESVLVAKNFDEFTIACDRLLTFVNFRNKIASRAKKVVTEHYSYSTFLKIIKNSFYNTK